MSSAAVAEIELPGEELDDQQQFIFIQAKVNAMRYEIDEVEAEKAIVCMFLSAHIPVYMKVALYSNCLFIHKLLCARTVCLFACCVLCTPSILLVLLRYRQRVLPTALLASGWM